MKGLREYLRRERRRTPRHPVCVDVEFYIYDGDKKKPRTSKARGCLAAISTKGACLQTNSLRIDDYHLLLDSDLQGSTVLAIEMPSPSGENSWTIQAEVVSYDRSSEKRKYRFDVRLQFVNTSAPDLKNLEHLIKAKSPPTPGGPEP